MQELQQKVTKLVTKERIGSSLTGDPVQIQHMPLRTEIGKESPELIMCRDYNTCVAADCR